MDIRKLLAVGVVAVSVSACQTNGGGLGSTIGFETRGGQGGVQVIDESERAHLTAGLTTADYIAFAEEVTNKMLSSRQVEEWSAKQPRVILGIVRNNTDNENIRVKDIYDRIQETMFNSGLMRIVDASATDFDYIIKPELTSTRQYGSNGEELAYFTLQLKMFKLDGELVGQWSDDLALGRGAGA